MIIDSSSSHKGYFLELLMFSNLNSQKFSYPVVIEIIVLLSILKDKRGLFVLKKFRIFN